MKKKSFDCVAWQDQAALRLYEELKDMTREEELAYWRRVSEEAKVRYPRMRTLDPEDAGSR